MVVECLVVEHPAQSAPEKTQRSSIVLEVNYKTMSVVPLAYLKIRQTIFKYTTVGVGLKRVGYYKAPTNPLK